MAYRITWVAITLLFTGCNATHDPLPNKSTNWLRECTSDRMCSNGLTCLCGVCTKTCGQAADCGTELGNTRCTGVSRAALSNQCTPESAGDAEAICVAACVKDGDCNSSSGAFECRDQLCVVRPDAGMPPDAMVQEVIPDRPDAGRPVPDSGRPFLDSGPPKPFCEGPGCDGGIDEVVCTNVADANVCTQPCHVTCRSDQMCFGDACADLLASDQRGPTSQALDSSRLYWTTTNSRDELGNYRKDGAVQAATLQNGEVTTLASNRLLPTALAVNSTHVYWLEGSGRDPLTGTLSNDNAVWRVVLAGGDAELLVGGLPITSSLAVNDRWVFLLMQETDDAGVITSAVHRMPADGSGQPERLFAVGGDVGRLLIDDAGLCWSSNNQVGTAGTDGGGNPHVLSMTNDPLPQMAVDASAVYWAGSGTDAIASVLRAGGDARVVARDKSWSWASGIAVDRDYVYSGHREGQSLAWSVVRTDKVLGTSQVLLRGPSILGQMMLAVDDNAIYIVAQNDAGGSNGMVLRLAKP
jgi:hypothetical protein